MAKEVMLNNGQLGTAEQRIEEIEERIAWMNENLSGCDWCCGGGDEEMEELVSELKSLQS